MDALRNDEIDLASVSLDDPEQVAPGFHIFYAERIVGSRPATPCRVTTAGGRDTRGLPER